jgi:gamma-glutamylcyclotransferase (GGCT)/AIG2-like uncharacterized protein YtfP
VNDDNVLFIYGTLLPGLRLEREMAGAERLGEAQVRGQLYDIGSYPGLVEGEAMVRGELYRVTAQHLRHLDAVEEMIPDNKAASLYWRDRVQVVKGDFAGQQVWVYLYNQSVDGLRPIDGDYRKYLLSGR